jgi:acylaminoacyl-peptidase
MEKREVRIEDLRRFRFVSDPQISPDGEKIAFVLSSIDYEGDNYNRHIWMADTVTGEVEQFTYGEGSDTSPRWSPDGEKILFLSSGRLEEKKSQLWKIPRRGGEARLVADREGVTSPIWGPDSERVIFLSRAWIREETESDVKRVTRIKYKLNGVGTFEGRRMHLFTVRPGGEPDQLTEGNYDVEAVDWSPEGDQIALVANMAEDADVSRMRDIYIIPSEGGTPIKVTEGGHAIRTVSWSPDGDRLAFVGHDEPEELARDLDIWLMDPRGGDLINLTEAFPRSLMMGVGSDLRVSTPNPGAVWGLGSDSLYFATADIPYCNVYRVKLDGSVTEVIGNRVVDGFSLSRDNRNIAFNAMDATHPAELYLMRLDEEEGLTSFNDELLEEIKFVKPQHFTFENRLGRTVDGWIIKPINWREGAEYPMVLEMHGGPRGVYGDAPFHEFQVLAGQGFAVIYTNPRGSAGYDEEYAQAVMRHYGEVDYEDFMDFTDRALEAHPWIDEDKLGLTGGSYGGYTTNWIVTQTDRFKAGVTFRSICNWVSKFGCSDIGYMQPESISGCDTYWGDAMDEQLKHSPLRYVDRVSTPLLIVHSEEDLRCPMEEAEQWFTALQLNGVPSELIRFPEENHDLSRSGKPQHREERLQHMMRWFNKYLK